MRAQLQIVKHEEMKDYSDGKSLRFIIIDLDKADKYPMNFVCLLPKNLTNTKRNTTFETIFGNRSLEIAKKMLTYALKLENDPEIILEIKRRLSLLELDSTHEKICVSCGIKFQTNLKKKFKQKYCEDCTRKFVSSK